MVVFIFVFFRFWYASGEHLCSFDPIKKTPKKWNTWLSSFALACVDACYRRCYCYTLPPKPKHMWMSHFVCLSADEYFIFFHQQYTHLKIAVSLCRWPIEPLGLLWLYIIIRREMMWYLSLSLNFVCIQTCEI